MKQTNPLWLTLVLVIIFLGIGILIGRFSKQTTQITQIKQEIAKHALLFSSKSAEIQGKITNINGNMVTIQSVGGSSADFKLAEQVYVTKYDQKSKPVYSTKKEDLEINKEAILRLALPRSAISLQNSDAQFEVTAITYLP